MPEPFLAGRKLRGRVSCAARLACLGLLLACLPASPIGAENAPAPSAVAVPRLQPFDLLNGLHVIVAEMPGEKMAVQLLIRTGSSSIAPPKSSLAYLMAATLFQPAPGTPAAQFKNAEIPYSFQVYRDGLVLKAETTPDALDFTLRLMGQMAAQPVMTQDMLDQARQQLQKTYGENADPLELAAEQFRVLLFGRHSYGRPVWGIWTKVGAATLADLQELDRRCFVPDNATLIIVGPGPSADLLEVVRSRFGRWVKSGAQFAETPEYVDAGVSRVEPMAIPQLKEGGLVYGLSSPSRLSANYFKMELLNQILGGKNHSTRLEREFQARHIPATRLESRAEFFRAGGDLHVLAQVPPDAIAPALQAIADTVEGLKRTRVTPGELQAAQASLQQQFEESLKTPAGIAGQIALMEMFQLAPDYLVSFPRQLQQVTAEELQEAAKGALTTTRTITVLLNQPTGH